MQRLITSSEITWISQAKCKGQTDLFFGQIREKSWIRASRERKAITICNACPVMYQWRQYARENSELGVWGGETEDERYNAGFLKDANVSRRNKQRVKREKLADL